MSPVELALRSVARQPARAVLGIVGIAVVGALLFDMLMLSHGLVLSFRDLLDGIGYDVRVTATPALPTTGPPIEAASKLVAQAGALPEVADVVALAMGRAAVSAGSGEERIVPIVGRRGGTGTRGSWSIVEGESLPSGAAEEEGTRPSSSDIDPPVILSRSLARDLGVRPGASLQLRWAQGGASSALPRVRFRVVGIADFAFATGGEATAATTLEGLRRLSSDDADRADLVMIASRGPGGADGAAQALRAIRPDLHVFTNAQFLERFTRTDFSYFRQISTVLSSITLFFAFLLVATLLTVAVNQRLGEVAGLRAIGFSRRRVALDLLAEATLLVGAGALLSLPLGAALSRLLDHILKSMPGIPERLHFFVLEPRSVMLHLALLIGAGLLGALYPIRIATRLPIAATLRKEMIA